MSYVKWIFFMAIISLPHPKGSSHRLTRSPDGTIGKDEVSKLVQALDTKNFWTQVPVDASWVTVV